jgi:hypothetical protein
MHGHAAMSAVVADERNLFALKDLSADLGSSGKAID